MKFTQISTKRKLETILFLLLHFFPHCHPFSLNSPCQLENFTQSMLKRTSRHNETAEPLATKTAAAFERLVLTLAQRDVNAKCYHSYYQLRENFKNFVVVKGPLWKGSTNVSWGGISLSFQILPCVCMCNPRQQQNAESPRITNWLFYRSICLFQLFCIFLRNSSFD